MSNYLTVYKKKIIDPSDLKKKVQDIKEKGFSIATLNGSFDLLHAGHLQIIYEAKMQADILIVALNSDTSIKKYKSLQRPIIPLEQRLQMMAAIEFIDFVTWFEEIDPREILKIIKPHVHVNGSEYGENCIEAKVVKEEGGRIHLVNSIMGLSTSKIIEKIHALDRLS